MHAVGSLKFALLVCSSGKALDNDACSREGEGGTAFVVIESCW